MSPGRRAVESVAPAAAEKSRPLVPDLLVQDEDDRGDDGGVQEAHPDEHRLVDLALRHLRHLPVTRVVQGQVGLGFNLCPGGNSNDTKQTRERIVEAET